jgi:hypothetical protein
VGCATEESEEQATPHADPRGSDGQPSQGVEQFARPVRVASGVQLRDGRCALGVRAVARRFARVRAGGQRASARAPASPRAPARARHRPRPSCAARASEGPNAGPFSVLASRGKSARGQRAVSGRGIERVLPGRVRAASGELLGAALKYRLDSATGCACTSTRGLPGSACGRSC